MTCIICKFNYIQVTHLWGPLSKHPLGFSSGFTPTTKATFCYVIHIAKVFFFIRFIFKK